MEKDFAEVCNSVKIAKPELKLDINGRARGEGPSY